MHLSRNSESCHASTPFCSHHDSHVARPMWPKGCVKPFGVLPAHATMKIPTYSKHFPKSYCNETTISQDFVSCVRATRSLNMAVKVLARSLIVSHSLLLTNGSCHTNPSLRSVRFRINMSIVYGLLKMLYKCA
jgi:hypothetical protein